MKTITIIAGNSDNKLKQVEWSDFVADLAKAIARHASAIHFSGGPDTVSHYQNFAFVVQIPPWAAKQIKRDVARVRAQHGQDSVAWIEGVTKFV